MPSRRTFDEDQAFGQKLRQAVASNSIATATREELAEYMAWLCEDGGVSKIGGTAQFSEFCELVRFHMLRSLIDAFEERSKITNRWVLFFAFLAIAATLMPYLIAPNPIFGATPSTKESTAGKAQGSTQAQPLVASAPSLVQRPSSGQAKASSGSSAASSSVSK